MPKPTKWTDPIYQVEVDSSPNAIKYAPRPVIVGKYRLHFGDPASPVAFDRLSDKDKMAKAEAAAKIDAARKKDKK